MTFNSTPSFDTTRRHLRLNKVKYRVTQHSKQKVRHVRTKLWSLPGGKQNTNQVIKKTPHPQLITKQHSRINESLKKHLEPRYKELWLYAFKLSKPKHKYVPNE